MVFTDASFNQIRVLETIHHLLPPVLQCVVYSDDHIMGATKPAWKEPPGVTRKNTKFKLSDSIRSIVLLCKANPNEKIASLAYEKHKKGLHFHPLIVVIMKQGVPSKFWLYYNSVTIVVPTFVEALQALLKHYLVFNFQYPAESSKVCQFLVHYFFGIKLDRIPGRISIRKLIKSIP